MEYQDKERGKNLNIRLHLLYNQLSNKKQLSFNSYFSGL